VIFPCIELFGGSMSVYSHQAYRNYTKGSVLKFCSILIMDWLCTQQIEKIVCIEVCSFQLCSSLNYFCSGPIHAFLLFRAIIRAHFLLIWLQQHSWNCDKHLLAPNPESEYNNAPNSCFSFPCNLIWLPMFASNKISFSVVLCFSGRGSFLHATWPGFAAKGAIGAGWLQCWSR